MDDKEYLSGANKEFSSRDKEILASNGYLVYRLTGKTISSIQKEGLKLSSNWQNHEPSLLQLTSRDMEIAINPKEIFMPGSANKTLDQHEHMLPEYIRVIAARLKGIRASLTIGDAQDYLELASLHFKATGQRLFGKDFGYQYTTTATGDDTRIVIVGRNIEGTDILAGLHIERILRGKSYKGVLCAPILVPEFSSGDPRLN